MRNSAKYKVIFLFLILILVGIYIYLKYDGFQSYKPRELSGKYCPAGFWCPASNKVYACPGGSYGSTEGLKVPSCSGKCEPGFMCPEGSISAQEKPCPAGYFCVEGTGGANVPPVLCPSGHYCPTSSKEPRICPPGTECPEGTISVPSS